MVVGEFTMETELAVIGGGPAGYTAAFRAASLGIDVTIIDPRPMLGGMCLHDGCIPSKTLLHIAQIKRDAIRAKEMGVSFGEPVIDLEALRAWVDKSVTNLAKGLASRAKTLGVELVQGTARFESSKRLTILNDGDNMHLKFRRALITTGSRPTSHAMLSTESSHVQFAAEAIHFKDVPPSLAIIGNDYQAVELAMIYAALGSSVVLVAEQGILPDLDDDLRKPLRRALANDIEAIVEHDSIQSVNEDSDALQLQFSKRDSIRVHRAVVSIGRCGATDGLDLQTTDVRIVDDNLIAIDDRCATNDKRIFAAGDVTPGPPLANRGIHQGRIAAECIAGWDTRYEPQAVPHAVFTDPNVAWCGLMESDAAGRQGLQVSRIRWGASGRAVGIGRQDGMTKIIFEPATELVLGVGIVGPHAAEMIGEAALAIEMGATLTDIAATIHPHPSMSELISDLSCAEAQALDEGPMKR